MARFPTIRGTWRSDRRRTIAEWRFKKFRSKSKRESFLRIFGKLMVTYGARRQTLQYDDLTFSNTYRVEARDSSTIVIRIFEDGEGPGHLQCLYFETPDLYWITVGWNREWFHRAPRKRPNKSLERTRDG
jgi:hypothetical protein